MSELDFADEVYCSEKLLWKVIRFENCESIYINVRINKVLNRSLIQNIVCCPCRGNLSRIPSHEMATLQILWTETIVEFWWVWWVECVIEYRPVLALGLPREVDHSIYASRCGKRLKIKQTCMTWRPKSRLKKLQGGSINFIIAHTQNFLRVEVLPPLLPKKVMSDPKRKSCQNIWRIFIELWQELRMKHF